MPMREDRIMPIANKWVTALCFRGRHIVFASAIALLGPVPSARASITDVVSPPNITLPSSAIADSYGTVLTVAELAGNSGKGIFAESETNALVSLLKALDKNGKALAGSAARGTHLALASNSTKMAAVPTARSQLAALNDFSQTIELSNRLLGRQNATGAFDTSLRYLCADKIYSDLYPHGTGWNNHAYADCSQGGQLDPDRLAHALTNVPVPPVPPPGDTGGGFVLIPCSGSISNVSSMTIGPAVVMSPTMTSAGPTIASLSSFTSQLGRGHR
jgi:hypothetical protein